jgi:multicomponent Na+:H+ antiporter subunit F
VNAFLLAAAGFILATVGLGLARLLRGPGDPDRMMAVALLGTGGVAVLLLLGVATGIPGAIDVGVTLALLAAFAAVAFGQEADAAADDTRGGDD